MKVSVDLSTIKVYPSGTQIESPALGSTSPFQVSSSEYNKPEKKCTHLSLIALYPLTVTTKSELYEVA